MACHIPRYNQDLVWSLKASGSIPSSYRNEYHLFVGSCLGPRAGGNPSPKKAPLRDPRAMGRGGRP